MPPQNKLLGLGATGPHGIGVPDEYAPVYGYYPHLNPRVAGGKPNTAATPEAKGALAEALLGALPGSGEAMSARDAWNASGRAGNALLGGDWRGAASGYGDLATALAGAIPGLGAVARGTTRGAAWMDRNLPGGVNRLLDNMVPKDAGRTMFSGVGPTADLPMDEASRMARAKGMGYADEPFYRGEASGRLREDYDGTPFFSRDEDYARGFAQQGGNADPREFRLKTPNAFSDRAPLTAGQYGRIVEAAAANDPQLANDLAEQIAPGKGVDWVMGFGRARPDFVVVEPGGTAFVRHAIERGSADPIGLFRAAGFDALDSGRDVRMLTGEGIRLKDARFDPSQSGSRNILAGVAGASLLPAYLLSQDPTSPQD